MVGAHFIMLRTGQHSQGAHDGALHRQQGEYR